MEENVLEITVVPEIPRVISEQQTFVYVPTATYKNSGVSKFDYNSFIVEADGTVRLRKNLDTFVTSISVDDTAQTITITYDGGITSTIPISACACKVVKRNAINELSFSESSWLTDGQLFTLTFFDYEIGFNDNKYTAVVEALSSDNSYTPVIVQMHKYSDGSIILIADEPFDGRILSYGLEYEPLIDNTLTESGVAADAKAVGDELKTVADELKTVKTNLSAAMAVLDTHTAEIESNTEAIVTNDAFLRDKLENAEKDINKNTTDIKLLYTGLKQGNIIIPAELENSSVSRQTADGLAVVDGSTATVNKIQGNSVASKNLLDPSLIRATQTINGVTFTNNGDGTITANGTATAKAEFVIQSVGAKNGFVGADKWYFSGCPAGGSDDTYRIQERSYEQKDFGNGALSGNIYYNNVAIIIASGYTANNLVFKPTISYDSPIPYADFEKYQFWAGFKNAQFKGIKSTGKNLVNTGPIELKGTGMGKIIWQGDIEAPCIITWKENFSRIGTPSASLFKFVVNGEPQWAAPNQYFGKSIKSGHLTEIQVINSCVATGTLYDIMLEIGTLVTPYTPYTESVMELPETVELGVYDYIDVERQKIVRQTGKYIFIGDWANDGSWKAGDIGTSGWGGTNTCGFYVYIDGTNGGKNLDWLSGCITTPIKYHQYSGYDTDNVGTTVGNYYFSCRVSRSTLTAYGSDNSSDEANKTAFKAYLADLYAKGTPLTFVYKTKTAIEEDITITKDGYIVYDKGREQMQLSNSESVPTVTAEYLILGGAE